MRALPRKHRGFLRKRAPGAIKRLLLAPARCVVCQQNAFQWNVCRMCWQDLPRLPAACVLCALPLQLQLGTCCGPCLLKPPPWQTMTCAVAYAEPYDALVGKLKFQGQTEVIPVMAALLAERLQTPVEPSPFDAQTFSDSLRPPDVIVPVPIHWTRCWRRGFNQAELLGRALSRSINVPVYHALTRTRRTRAQTLIEPDRRRANLRGAFGVLRPVGDVHVALVDDVVTSGATALSATHALLANGAASVRLWAFARAHSAGRR